MKERKSKAERIQTLWMGNNLSKEGLDSIMDGYKSNSQKKEDQNTQEINNNWKKLASLMSRCK